MHELQKYERAKLTISVFENDAIQTDLAASKQILGPKLTQDMLPVFFIGAPVSGLGDMEGQRDTINN